MIKPKPFIHWRKTTINDELGAVFIGRRVFPVSWILTVVLLGGLAVSAAVGGALAGVTGDGGWWAIPLVYFLGLLVLTCIIMIVVGVVTMVVAGLRTYREANSEEAWRKY